MTDKNAAPDYADVESRRSKDSLRRLSAGRKLTYAIGLPLLRGIIRLLNATYRIERIIGVSIFSFGLMRPGVEGQPRRVPVSLMPEAYLEESWASGT